MIFILKSKHIINNSSIFPNRVHFCRINRTFPRLRKLSWFSSYLPPPPLRATHILISRTLDAFCLFFYFMNGIIYTYWGISLEPTPLSPPAYPEILEYSAAQSKEYQAKGQWPHSAGQSAANWISRKRTCRLNGSINTSFKFSRLSGASRWTSETLPGPGAVGWDCQQRVPCHCLPLHPSSPHSCVWDSNFLYSLPFILGIHRLATVFLNKIQYPHHIIWILSFIELMITHFTYFHLISLTSKLR